MPSNLFFVADTHFRTPGVLKFRTRYSSVEEHDESLIARWNSVVKKGDRVYHLGDLGAGSQDGLRAILDRLNGTLFAIEGNHDEVMTKPRCRDRFVWIRQAYYLRVGEERAWLSHFPFMTWSGMWRGCVSLHGHTHGNMKDDKRLRRLDVGVDAWNDTPVAWEKLSQILRERPVPTPDIMGWERPL